MAKGRGDEGPTGNTNEGVVRVAEYQARVGDLQSKREHAEIDSINTDTTLRKWMASILTVLFVALNGVVVYMVWHAGTVDQNMITAAAIKPSERLITEKVYMSLIGGTVLQVAAIVLAIARYLFPARK